MRKLTHRAPSAPAPRSRRRRREETGRGFKAAARMLRRVAFNLFFHHPADVFDIDERRAEAERLLRMQVDEWTNEGHGHEQNESFHYAANADFDPHP